MIYKRATSLKCCVKGHNIYSSFNLEEKDIYTNLRLEGSQKYVTPDVIAEMGYKNKDLPQLGSYSTEYIKNTIHCHCQLKS